MRGMIRNVVIGSPGSTYEDYLHHGKPLASFYADLLGWRIIREDWIKIAADETAPLQFAFGDGWSDERPPRWPDPDYPQQLHLDFFARDLGAVEELVLERGATRIQDKGSYRSYADPVGHPFCLYPDPDGATQTAPARVGRIVFDCLSPRSLAAFYEELLDMRRRIEDTPKWVVIAGEGSPMLAFQYAHYLPPRWPDPAYSPQIHLDLFFDDHERAQELALRLGAVTLPPPRGSCPVYADPAGHPFCLCAPGQ
jgi:hypothetical protein